MNKINDARLDFKRANRRDTARGQGLRVGVHHLLGNARIYWLSECAFDHFQTRTKRALTRCAFIKWRLREMIKAQAGAFDHFLKRRQTRKCASNYSKTYQELQFRVRTTGGGRAPSMAKAGRLPGLGWFSPIKQWRLRPDAKNEQRPYERGQEKKAARAISNSLPVRSADQERQALLVTSDEKRAAVDYTVAQAVAAALLTRWPDMNLAMFGGSAFRMPDRSHDDGDRISNGWQPCRPTI